MFNFPKDLYCDVRIERTFKTNITYENGILTQNKEGSYCGGFVRIYDGDKWYYSSVTDDKKIQDKIDELSSIAIKNKYIYKNPSVEKFQVNIYDELKFKENGTKNISNKDKVEYIKSFIPVFNGYPEVVSWNVNYIDRYVLKEFYSSKGTRIKYDNNVFGPVINFTLKDRKEFFNHRWQKQVNSLKENEGDKKEFSLAVEEGINFIKNGRLVEPGEYTVVLAPVAAGIFAHESFGHKSEADFMIGDEGMRAEWQIGKKVGSNILSIVDWGDIQGGGYTPFDDEGNRCTKTYLIKEGKLSGRLHDAETAAIFEDKATGNGRAINFEFEPIPRMTNTYIESGDKTFDELISDIKDGIYIKDIRRGSGMSTFTLAPTICYRIRNGKIAEPLKVAIATGTVFETLNLIDGLSNKVDIVSFLHSGCGKMEQFPLPVGFGGPYVRVKKLSIR